MKTNKILNFIGMLCVLILITVVFTAADNYILFNTPFESGRLAGYAYWNVLQSLFTFIAVYLVYKNFSLTHHTRNFVYLILVVLFLSSLFTLIENYLIYGSDYQSGYRAGSVFKHLLETICTVFLYVLFFKRNKTKILEPKQ